MSKRTAIPVDVRTLVLTEAGYRCAVPTCRGILALDLHHLVEVAEGGGNAPGNLIALCPTCHALFHRGTIKRESIAAWKSMLVSLGHAFDSESVDLLLLLDALDGPLPVSIDGMLRFARLISSRFVELQDGGGYGDGRPWVHWTHVGLTQRGRLFVDAWKKGDRAALATSMGATTSAIPEQDSS